MKKIVIVTGDIIFGGAERISVYLANYFSKQGIKVFLLSPSNLNSAYSLGDISHICLKIDTRNSNKLTRFISLIKKLRKEIINIQPDVVLGMMAYHGAAASIATLGSNIPVVVSERIDPASTTSRTTIEKSFYKFVFSFITEGLVFQTKEAVGYYPSRVQKKSTIIPNPLFQDKIPKVNRPSMETKKIVSVGRLVEQKNHKLLIYAFKDLLHYYPDYKLIIYGEGKLRSELEEIIASNNLTDKVFLPGNVENIFEKLQEADLFVLSSNYEGMPNALIEAMAMGVPVVSTDCKGGGASFLIENGINGLLVPIGDQKSMEEAMRKLINDRCFAYELGLNAQKIRKTLDGNLICAQWKKFMENVISKVYKKY